jgi:cytochrome P450
VPRARTGPSRSLDGAEHAAYRTVVNRYLTASAVVAQELQCRAQAAAIVDALPRTSTVDAIAEFGTPFAVRTQATWLGWPADIEEELVVWMADNFAATRSGDRARTAEVAARFDALVGHQVRVRREAGGAAPRDVTTRLLHETVHGRPLTDEEVVSILRNWTAGDLGSLAACLGVMVHRLATNPDRQDVTRHRVARGSMPRSRPPSRRSCASMTPSSPTGPVRRGRCRSADVPSRLETEYF